MYTNISNHEYCCILDFKADGLLDEFTGGSLALDVTGGFDIQAALMFGAKLTITKEENSLKLDASIAFDPIVIQIFVDGSLHPTVSFGMIQANGDASVALKGRAELAYCKTTLLAFTASLTTSWLPCRSELAYSRAESFLLLP